MSLLRSASLFALALSLFLGPVELLAQPVPRQLANLNRTVEDFFGGDLTFMGDRPVNGRVLLSATNPGLGTGLFSVFPGSSDLTLLIAGQVNHLGSSAGHAYFSVALNYDVYSESVELYRTDGTVAGTEVVALVRSLGYTDYVSGSDELRFIEENEVGGAAIYRVARGAAAEKVLALDGGYVLSGMALADGTWLLNTRDENGADVVFAVRGATASVLNLGLADLRFLHVLDAGVLIVGSQNNKKFLALTDGTTSGTKTLREVEWIDDWTGDSKRAFFEIEEAGGRKLLVSDGTTSGTRPIDFNLNLDFFDFEGTAVSEGRLFLSASWNNLGQELVMVDGSSATMVKDICFGVCSSWPAMMGATDDGVYFLASDGVHGTELWFTSGTSNGTVFLGDLDLYNGSGSNGDSYSSISDVSLAAEGAFFVLDSEVWYTGGTPQSTRSFGSEFHL